MVLRKAKTWQKIVAGVSAFIIFLGIWHLVTLNEKIGKVMPGPIEVINRFITAFWDPIGTETMTYHILITLSRCMIGFLSASVLGIILGLTMGWYRKVEMIARPLFEIVRPIPTLAWIPLVILWCGIGEFAKYTLVFIGAFLSIAQNAYLGAKSVDKTIVNAAKMLGCNDRQLFFTIVIPSAVPAIAAGLQIGVASAWASVVAAEMVRATSGVGWLVVTGQSNNDMTQVLVGILAIATIGLILSIVIRKVEDVLCRWNKRGR
jgi:ABC-type nitrate/sulfonate/bicarbonate transport system permease component